MRERQNSLRSRRRREASQTLSSDGVNQTNLRGQKEEPLADRMVARGQPRMIGSYVLGEADNLDT